MHRAGEMFWKFNPIHWKNMEFFFMYFPSLPHKLGFHPLLQALSLSHLPVTSGITSLSTITSLPYIICYRKVYIHLLSLS